MDKTEPALIPEWLKSSGSVTSGGYGNHQSASYLHSDDHSVSKHARNNSSINSSESFHSDRTTSSYFRRSTSSKDSSHLRSHSSFNRSHHDRVWEDFPEFSDKDKFILTEHRHHEYPDPLGGALSGKFSKENLRRSQSLVSRKLDATSSRKVTRDSSDAIKSSSINNNSLLLASGSVQSSMQTAFGRDFPSLGTEPKLGASELRRVPSPVLGPTVQSFPLASVNVIGVDGWTSSLAEVPGLIANSSASSLLSQQAASGSLSPLSQRAGGLNMAEAVAQGPSRARTPPQASLDTQRLEELAIKQSRQLIPVIPSITKPAALGPLEKLKPKSGVQQPLQQSQLLSLNHGSQSLRNGPAKLDPGKTTNMGKLQVLKPSREMLNGIPSFTKETVSPKNGVKVVHSPLSQTPSSAAITAPNKSPNKALHLSVPERKAVTLLTSLEKKPSQQVQSRIDFFNLLKKKSSATNPPRGRAGSGSEKSNGEASSSSKLDPLGSSVENGIKVMNNGQGSKENHLFVENGEEEHSDVAVPDPDEEEAAFLRSLGWEECAGEEEGLTEEEIKAFYEVMKVKPPPPSEATGVLQRRLNNGSCAASSSSVSRSS